MKIVSTVQSWYWNYLHWLHQLIWRFIIWWIVKWRILFRWVYCAVRHIVSISLLSESNTVKLHFQRHFPICVDVTVAFADAHVEFWCTFRLNKCHIALFLRWKKWSIWMEVFATQRCCKIVWFDLKTQFKVGTKRRRRKSLRSYLVTQIK